MTMTSEPWKLISFYSEPEAGHYYTKKAQALKARCEELGIDHYIAHRESAGSWVNNTRQKPSFIKECREKFSGPLLWVDVDSEIHSKPDMDGFLDLDFAGGPIVGRQSRIKPPLLVMGITLLFGDTDGARWLLNKWEELCGRQQNENYGDHRLLSHILHEEIPVDWKFLPEPYARSNSARRASTPVISLGRAVSVESRRVAMERLSTGVMSSKIDGTDIK